MVTADFRLGRWEDVLADVEVDLLATDTPYSARTHAGQKTDRIGGHDSQLAATGLAYEHWSPEDVRRFVAHWAPRTRGWFCALTDHVLGPHWEDALKQAGRYTFTPVPCVMPGANVRVAGDGPSSYTVQLIVARPRTREAQRWRTTRGHYLGPGVAAETRASGDVCIHGGKPLWLMQEIVVDYSNPGDIVGDPCAGAGTTLVATLLEGRRAVGSELSERAHRLGVERMARIRAETHAELRGGPHGGCGGYRRTLSGGLLCACGTKLSEVAG